MTKTSKQKLLTTTVLLTVLLISTTYALLVPTAHAAEITTKQKGLAIMSNVINLNLEKYKTTSQELPQDSYMDIVPQENTRYLLDSNGSRLDVLATFANGKLRMINVLESQGTPFLTKSTTKSVDLGNTTVQVVDTVGTAKSFLNNYQSYTGNSFYSQLTSMLNGIDAAKNSVKIDGNIKLQINISQTETNFK